MTALELEAYRAELAREILSTDSWDLLDKIKKLIKKEQKAKVTKMPCEYSKVEMADILSVAESELDLGEGIASDKVHEEIKNKYPFL